jgi:hypothetical protein
LHFNGLPPSTLAVIGAIAAAAVIALYVLKQRRRPVPVPFAKLWQRVLRDQEATSLFSQLKRIFSLLLQLCLLALLLFALGDPRGFAAKEARNVVVLIDASASMKAVDVATALEPNKTRIDVAKDELRRIVGGLAESDRMLVAQMDASVTPLSTLTGEPADLEAAASLVRATDTRADFPRSLRFATDVLRGLSSPEIIVISDGNLGDPRDAAGDVHLGDARLFYVPVGTRGRNVAFTELSVRRYPLDRDRYEVMLELTNTGSASEDVELSLLGDGNLVDVTRLKLGPGERLPRFYPNLSGARRALEASIKLVDGGHDDLPADDRAYALLPDQRRIRVLCVTGGNTYLEAALLLTSYLDVTYVAPSAYPPPAGSTYDVTIFDGVAPRLAPGGGNVLYLDPSGEASPLKVDPAPLVNVGFDKIDRKSPLLRWTAIDDVYVGKAHKLVPEPGDKVVGASDKGALLVTGRRDQTRFVALGFDPRDSDLVLRIAWPLLVLNTLTDFVADDPSYLSSFRTGEVWHIPMPAEGDDAWLNGPAAVARRIPVKDGRAVYFGLDAGIYTLEAGPKGATSKTEFAANLADPEESAIEPKPALTVDGQSAGKVTGFHVGIRSEWWIALLLAAVILTTLEWATYHRRITV